MTPVMARCPCGWPVADCIEHNPPSLFAPTVTPHGPDPFGLVEDDEPPPAVVTIALGGLTIAAVTILGGIAATTWAAKTIRGTLKGRP